MTLQALLGDMRRAIEDFSMIESGDRVAVGLSGGKDSLALLLALSRYRKFSPSPFTLAAVTVDMGFTGADFSALTAFCESEGVEHEIIRTDIAEVIFDVRKEKNPCSLCSKMRRGALNSHIRERGFNKLALGHHADDLLETMLLSFFYEGRLSTFAPIGYMSRTGITLIRPLIYALEKDVAAVARDLPVTKNPCPANHETQREYVKNLVKSIQKDIPFAKDRMIAAIVHPERYNLWDRYPLNPDRSKKK